MYGASAMAAAMTMMQSKKTTIPLVSASSSFPAIEQKPKGLAMDPVQGQPSDRNSDGPKQPGDIAQVGGRAFQDALNVAQDRSEFVSHARKRAVRPLGLAREDSPKDGRTA